nr:hypothetical protein Itr_chr14CG07420 [Ipomoea trifida]
MRFILISKLKHHSHGLSSIYMQVCLDVLTCSSTSLSSTGIIILIMNATPQKTLPKREKAIQNSTKILLCIIYHQIT